MTIRSMAAIAVLLTVFAWGAQADENDEPLVFGTAPTSSAADTEAAYAGMIDYLSRSTGKKFVLQTAANYMEYQVKMRNGTYDLVFDGPPFVAWRIDRLEHVPLVRLPADIKMIVIARDDSKYSKIEELATHHVATCVVPSPNTLTLIFLSYFPHPARQPHLLPIEGFKNIEQCVRSGKGEIAVLRDTYWKKMDQTGMRVLFEPGVGYPERTITAGPKVSAEVREKIIEALTSEGGTAASKQVLSRFQRDKFVKASAADYKGLEEMLRPVWGFY